MMKEPKGIAGLDDFVAELFIDKYIPITSSYHLRPGIIMNVHYQEMMQFSVYWRDPRLVEAVYRYYTLDDPPKMPPTFAVTTDILEGTPNLIVPKSNEYKTKTITLTIPVKKTTTHVSKRLVRQKNQFLGGLFSRSPVTTEPVEAPWYEITTMDVTSTKVRLKMDLVKAAVMMNRIYAENSTFINTVLNK